MPSNVGNLIYQNPVAAHNFLKSGEIRVDIFTPNQNVKSLDLSENKLPTSANVNVHPDLQKQEVAEFVIEHRDAIAELEKIYDEVGIEWGVNILFTEIVE